MKHSVSLISRNMLLRITILFPWWNQAIAMLANEHIFASPKLLSCKFEIGKQTVHVGNFQFNFT